MRDYGIVSPKFWVGQTGKALRGNPQSQLLALYLMTSPHASMIGVFHCPILYMAHETGMDMEGASKALASLIEAGFCTFDEASEEVFVKRMAAFQIGEQLDAKDNRCKGIAKEVEKIESPSVKAQFISLYSVAFHIPAQAGKASPFEAPSKPRTGSGSEAGSEVGPAAPPARPSAKGSRLNPDWQPNAELQAWAATERPDLDCKTTVDSFVDFWKAKTGKDAAKLDWDATFRNWVRSQRQQFKVVASGASMFAGGK